nr:metal ABC transporter substrate-binding protein [uncultured Treponema sp.]
MKIFSKLFSVCALLTFLGIFTACKGEGKSEASGKGKIKIVVTTFPVYDWVCDIVKDKADVELLINSGADLHSWNPSAKDIIKVTGKDTDLFVYIGGESDFWVSKLIPQMEANGVQYFSIMKNNVELLEPMEEHDHNHEESEGEESEDFNPDEYDEHIWLSLKRVPLFIESIAEKISEVDEENSDFYLMNAKLIASEKNALYEKYCSEIEKCTNKTIVLADRNPFVYLSCDLGLEIYAAFHGCSADTEASFDVVLELVKIIEEKNLSAVACCDIKNRLSETVNTAVKSRDLNVVVLDSMQGKIQDKQTYDSIMTENLKKIKLALESE